ncbi:alpha/beta hydrolase [Pleomorphomonas carboxyditropha]|uniref:Esterase n=1 Tax=Pleomorphomonas carboxyditropha TaxID=2023338 RepID=A0A2G9WUG1_9HYPH|nr:alpha/beta fold hydrolase [Pleomorphomonas carboxyditropha]PIO97952.1 hypothetical protein CJ014_17665 [Pleomorphomonas carboxyditropha]
MKLCSSLVLFALLTLLAACADRPGPDALRATAVSAPGARTVTVYVATTRQRAEGQDDLFTASRADQVSYARFTISVPPGHKAGEIEWPGRTPDPGKDFVTVERRLLDRAAFEQEVSRRRGGRPPSVGVFVHGYNTNFTEAVFRMAQMSADAGVDGVPILFAWPSEGSVTGYVADKDAVTYSRDQLTELLTMLARRRTTGPITLVGHSMGGWLTAETVRQLRLTGQDAVVRRLHVILAAPDIDVDVFRSQLAVIGPLDPPMVILVSPDDSALGLSEFLSADRRRTGRLDVNDPAIQEATRAAGIQVVDISGLETSDSFRHNRFVALAARYPQFATMEQSGAGASLRQTGAFVLNTVGTAVSSPFVLAGKVIGSE